MRCQDEIIYEIEYIKKNKIKTCIFGAGRFGSEMAYDILKNLGISVLYYCDNNPTLWGKIVRDDVTCHSPNIILQKEIKACFIFIGSKAGIDEVSEQVKKLNCKIIVTLPELLELDIITNSFLNGKIVSEQEKKEHFEWDRNMLKKGYIHNNNNKECIVFTCITGNYDHINEPKFYSKNCDYYLISDKKPGSIGEMQWIDINTIIPEIVTDNIRKNRFCKINAPYIFSEYKYSIYVDGTIEILGDLNKYLNKIGKSGIAIFKHPERNCIYSEAIACGVRGADKLSKIYTQVKDYQSKGMPHKYGLFECTILVRDNSNPTCQKLMLDWWNEVFNQSYRDQLSFTYCLWKNGLKYEDVGVLGENYRMSTEIRRARNHKYKY